MPKVISLMGIVLILMLSSGGNPASSQSTPPSKLDPDTPPFGSPFLHIFECYDAFTGNLLNCQVFDQLVGLVPPPTDPANTGGHLQHTAPAPLTDGSAGANGFICLLCTDFNQDPLIVQTFTNSDTAIVLHQVPQFAGRIQVQSVITPPPGWSCITSCTFQFVEEIGVDGLSELEATGVNHMVVRGGTTTHPVGASGTSDTLNRVRIFAQIYKMVTNNGLSVNDISLPRGGKFDLANAYGEADDHIYHRRGTDFDVNSRDLGGQAINCLLNKDLQISLKNLGAKKKVCHSTGAYHVGF